MELIASCIDIEKEEWDKLMKGTKPCSGRLIRNKIKRNLPWLYKELCLDFTNPFEEQCRKKKGLYVYVHSAIEYFITY